MRKSHLPLTPIHHSYLPRGVELPAKGSFGTLNDKGYLFIFLITPHMLIPHSGSLLSVPIKREYVLTFLQAYLTYYSPAKHVEDLEGLDMDAFFDAKPSATPEPTPSKDKGKGRAVVRILYPCLIRD